MLEEAMAAMAGKEDWARKRIPYNQCEWVFWMDKKIAFSAFLFPVGLRKTETRPNRVGVHITHRRFPKKRAVEADGCIHRTRAGRIRGNAPPIVIPLLPNMLPDSPRPPVVGPSRCIRTCLILVTCMGKAIGPRGPRR